MSRSLVIAEKPSQARNIKAAIGSEHGEVLSAVGHLLRPLLPHEHNPDWKKWQPLVFLQPTNERYFKLRRDDEAYKKEYLSRIEKSLKTADTVIIATDPDREGQMIGQNLVEFFRFKGAVKRVIFNAEDKKTLRDAFRKQRSNNDFLPLFQAGRARQQADQIVNLSHTRAASVMWGKMGCVTIGIGRVKSAVLGMICLREEEIVNFNAKPYFVLQAEFQEGFALIHTPDAQISEKDVAEKLAAEDAKVCSSTLKVTTKKGCRELPPLFFNLNDLQKATGWNPKKTLDVLQSLYENEKLLTYPRSECRYLPESMISTAEPLFATLTSLYGISAQHPVVRKGNAYSDTKMKNFPHHAIIPNPNVVTASLVAVLAGDKRTLFDIVAHRYILQHSEDHIFDEVRIRCSINSRLYETRQKKISVSGWKSLLIREKKDSDATALSAEVRDGQKGHIDNVVAKEKIPVPPKRYTLAGLPAAMESAHRLIKDKAMRDTLKNKKGVGTPATRATIIDGLEEQKQIVVNKSVVKPTPFGMDLWRRLLDIAPDIVSVEKTAQMEAQLEKAENNDISSDEVFGVLVREGEKSFEAIKRAGKQSIDSIPERSCSKTPSSKRRTFIRRSFPKKSLKNYETTDK